MPKSWHSFTAWRAEIRFRHKKLDGESSALSVYPYIWPLIASAAISLSLGIYALTRRLKSKGARCITNGVGNNCFGPGMKLTRGQFIVMAMKAYGIEPDINPTDNFADAAIPSIQVFWQQRSDLAFQPASETTCMGLKRK